MEERTLTLRLVKELAHDVGVVHSKAIEMLSDRQSELLFGSLLLVFPSCHRRRIVSNTISGEDECIKRRAKCRRGISAVRGAISLEDGLLFRDPVELPKLC